MNLLSDEDLSFAAYAFHYQRSRRFPNGLDLLTIYEIETAFRPNRTMATLQSAYCVEFFENIAKDMASYACATALLESISNLCPDNSTVIDLFSTTLSAFAAMNTAPDLSTLTLAWFESFLFAQLGILPNLNLCAQCGAPLQVSTFYQSECGFVCPACAQNDQNLPPFLLPSIQKLHAQTLRTTIQNALKNDDHTRRNQFLKPVLRFLASVMCDNSPYKQLKAHRCMAQMALLSADLFPAP